MTTQAGILAFDKRQEVFEHYDQVLVGNEKFIFNDLEEVLFDRAGNLWFGAGEIWKKNHTKSNALFRFVPELNSFEVFTPNDSSIFRPICLYEAMNGDIWIGTYGNKIIKFDPNTLQFQEYPFDSSIQSNLKKDHPITSSITGDCYGRLWIGVINKGLYCYEPWSTNFKLYHPNPEDDYSLKNLEAWKLLTTLDGTIWITGGKKGAFFAKIGDLFQTGIPDQNNAATTKFSTDFIRRNS